MNRTTVAVSDQTLRGLEDAGQFPSGVSFVSLTGAEDSVHVLWRRQPDRTSWVEDCMKKLPNLRWIHTDTAGVDRLPLERLKDRGIVLTSATTAHGPGVGEWVLAALLMGAKRLDETVRASDRREWGRRATDLQLEARRVVVVGTGAAGSSVIRLCSAFGMDVVGINRTGHPTSTEARYYAFREDWMAELKEATFLVNCLPLTEETVQCLDSRVLGRLPSYAWFINAGRGESVNEAALATLVHSRSITGAILDTTIEEPLGLSSQLWGSPNIIISPHLAGHHDQSECRTRDLFATQLARYVAGQSLMSPVSLEKGY